MSEETLPPVAPPPVPRPHDPEGGLSNKTKRIILLGLAGVVTVMILLSYFQKPSVAAQKKRDQLIAAKTAQQTIDAIRDKKIPPALQGRHLTEEEQNQMRRAGQPVPLTEQRSQITGSSAPAAQEKSVDQLIAEELKKLQFKSRFEDSAVLHSDARKTVPLAQAAAPAPPVQAANSLQPTLVPASDKKPTVVHYDDNILPEGMFFDCTLVNKLNGDNTGPMKCIIATDVYIPGTRKVVIPQGSVAIGQATKVNGFGQSRLAVAFNRVEVGLGAPGAYAISLEGPGMDEQGTMALKDRVNNHYASIFGASLAVGAIGAIAQLGNNQNGFGYDPSVQMRNGISQSMAQSSDRILERFLNRMPTIEIRPGTPIRIWLTGDLNVGGIN